MTRIVVYTDGACSKNGSKNAIASWAMWFPSNPGWSGAERVPGTLQTNNRGELYAILGAFRKLTSELGSASNDVDFYLYTDSEYSKNCLTKWVPGWIRKGWTTTSGTEVVNRDIIENILELQPRLRSVTYEYIRAHTGLADEHSKNNDRVDRMARKVLDDSVIVDTPAPIEVIDNCPLQKLGPPVPVGTLTTWIRNNLSTLDSDALDSALMRAFKETMSNRGLKVEVRKNCATLTSGLQIESIVINKRE